MAEIVKETRFVCSECREWYEDAGEALDCCPSGADEIEVYVCLGCGNEYCNANLATGCCGEENEPHG